MVEPSTEISLLSPASIDPFTYVPLDLSNTQAHVIRILDGRPDSTIQCNFWHTELDTNYSCLSYTWGGMEDRRVILIDGQKFVVRRNLFNFLNHARANNYRMPLWIDAICLNQKHATEPNHRVQIMYKIIGSVGRSLSGLTMRSRCLQNCAGGAATFWGGCVAILRMQNGTTAEDPSSRLRSPT
jgi:hypothetical protein